MSHSHGAKSLERRLDTRGRRLKDTFQVSHERWGVKHLSNAVLGSHNVVGKLARI